MAWSRSAPRAGVAKCGDDTTERVEEGPLPAALTGAGEAEGEAAGEAAGEGNGGAQKSPAEWAYERIILYIRNFEQQLDASQEVAIGFTGGDIGVLRIEGIGFFDPDIVTFYGTDRQGAKTQLIQHVSQLNVMLRALPLPDEEAEPVRIGFRLAQGLGKGSGGKGREESEPSPQTSPTQRT